MTLNSLWQPVTAWLLFLSSTWRHVCLFSGDGTGTFASQQISMQLHEASTSRKKMRTKHSGFAKENIMGLKPLNVVFLEVAINYKYTKTIIKTLIRPFLTKHRHHVAKRLPKAHGYSPVLHIRSAKRLLIDEVHPLDMDFFYGQPQVLRCSFSLLLWEAWKLIFSRVKSTSKIQIWARWEQLQLPEWNQNASLWPLESRNKNKKHPLKVQSTLACAPVTPPCHPCQHRRIVALHAPSVESCSPGDCLKQQ